MDTQKKKRITMPARWQFFILIPFSLCYAAFIVLGNWQKSADYSNLQNIGRILLWGVISYGVLFFSCLVISRKDMIFEYLRSKLSTNHVAATSEAVQNKRPDRWYVLLGFFLICLLSYLPYYLMYYPTWFNNDAIWQLEQILGWKARSNHHPFFHTLIMQVFVTIGYRLSGTYTGAVAFYTFWQMALVAFTFAFCLYVLYKRGTRLWWLVLALAFYIVLPVHGMLSICMGKDAFFVSALVFFAWMSHTFDLEKEKGYTQWILYFMTGLLVCLLRSNGILIFVGTAFVRIVCVWRHTRVRNRSEEAPGPVGKARSRNVPVRSILCAVAVLVCYLLYQGPVLKGLQVEPPDTIEGLTMPTQHLLCVYMRGGSLTEEEIAMMERVVPLKKMEDYYNPYLFDVTKNLIREEGSQDVIAENKWEYFKLWLRVGIRNPMLYLEGEVRQTAGYWAYRVPHYQYLYSEYFMVDNPFGIVNERKVFTYDDSLAMGEYLMKFQDLFNKVWSLGLNTWVMLFGLAYLAWQKKSALCYVPFIMLLLSLFLATPVYNEFRYAYGLFAAFPLLFGFTFGPADEEWIAQKRDGDEDEKMG